jgi:signal peptidase II
MSLTVKRWLLVLSVIVFVIALDQISKQIVINNLAPGDSYSPIPAIENVFQITRSSNTGAAFGFLPQVGDFFLILAVIVVFSLLIFYPRIDDNATITRIATGMVCGGALGNAIDRIRHEHVVDFVHYQIPGVVSNISNLAENAIVIGVFLILIDSWRLERIEQKKQDAQAGESSDMANTAENIPYNNEEERIG